MNHFLTSSIGPGRTHPLQLLEQSDDFGRSAFVCSDLFGFSQR